MVSCLFFCFALGTFGLYRGEIDSTYRLKKASLLPTLPTQQLIVFFLLEEGMWPEMRRGCMGAFLSGESHGIYGYFVLFYIVDVL
ncbi:MAG: hypothetical protein D6730_22770 [Bacteroidetes bacterium]|nr:MAG: hypothetical protein D6730_22770 [Bacteroidota bacterium]